jgi:drug/metabolite transporter (DMT)-like permease
MFKGVPSKRKAIIMAAIMTVIWSSSFIFIKIGLKELPALPFAGLRYSMAFLFMLPWLLTRTNLQDIRELKRTDWVNLAVLGVLNYPLNQGCLFLAMSYLPNTTVSLITNMGPILVALLGWMWLKEKLNSWQIFGMGFTITGALVFFLPVDWRVLSGLGVMFSLITLLSNSVGSVWTRKFMKGGAYPVLLVTGIPLGIGSIILAGGSSMWEWIPRISLQVWGILIFLSLINTTIAFTVWNIALRRLEAFEANVISSTMLVQIALMSWFFLGDVITWKMVAGMTLVMGGVVLVNARGRG